MGQKARIRTLAGWKVFLAGGLASLTLASNAHAAGVYKCRPACVKVGEVIFGWSQSGVWQITVPDPNEAYPISVTRVRGKITPVSATRWNVYRTAPPVPPGSQRFIGYVLRPRANHYDVYRVPGNVRVGYAKLVSGVWNFYRYGGSRARVGWTNGLRAGIKGFPAAGAALERRVFD